MAHRAVFAATLLLIIAASCALPRPAISLTIAGTDVPPSREISFCQGGGCSGTCGDGIAPTLPATVVRASRPVRLDFATGSEVVQIHGDVWIGERLEGSSVETFDLTSGERSYTSQRIAAGHYYIAVSIRWQRPFDRGDSSFAFHIDVRP